MAEDRGTGGVVALAFGLVVAVVVYLLVAPFRCTDEGTCDGLVAFHYRLDSAGHWQAIGAAALVGAIVSFLLWLVLGSEGPAHKLARIVATPLLVVGMGVSVLSHSVLLVLGPLGGGLVLWLMWASRERALDNSNPEPDPSSSQR